MRETLPISLCIIARNEEHNIGNCIGSIRELVSEIIVVINDCTDNTRGVAEGLGAQVYEHAWHGDTRQRNIALTYAKQPWVLACDSDEVFTDELKQSIVNFFKGDHKRYAGAYYARRSRFLGQWILHGDWYPDCVIRLFKNGSGTTKGLSRHPKVEVQGALIRLKGDLLHYTIDSLDDFIMKIPSFSEDFFQHQLKKGVKWSATRAISRSLWRFFRAYILKRGFLDGYRGFYLASASFFTTLHRYSRLYEYEQGRKVKKLE